MPHVVVTDYPDNEFFQEILQTIRPKYPQPHAAVPEAPKLDLSKFIDDLLDDNIIDKPLWPEPLLTSEIP